MGFHFFQILKNDIDEENVLIARWKWIYTFAFHLQPDIKLLPKILCCSPNHTVLHVSNTWSMVLVFSVTKEGGITRDNWIHHVNKKFWQWNRDCQWDSFLPYPLSIKCITSEQSFGKPVLPKGFSHLLWILLPHVLSCLEKQFPKYIFLSSWCLKSSTASAEIHTMGCLCILW